MGLSSLQRVASFCRRGFSRCGAQALECLGFSHCDLWAQSFQLAGLERWLSSCGMWAQSFQLVGLEHGLSSCGAWAQSL